MRCDGVTRTDMNVFTMPMAIRAVMERRDFSGEEMHGVMSLIMSGEATPAQIGGFLIGLRMKGETVEEIAAAAQVMRGLAEKVQANSTPLVDTCGTGGDGVSSFNISTASAFVVAAAGGHVAKHGNRAVSSKSGSADVLEAAGARIDLDAAQVARCIDEVGVGFMFAPRHHSAMKHAIGPRREMGVRTIFNLLGPLTNPASVVNQVVGVYSDQWLEPMARVLAKLGSRHVMVVHSSDGMDEISCAGVTYYAELKNGGITRGEINPGDFDVPACAAISELIAESPADSLMKIRHVFSNHPGAAADIVALNAGAAIYVSGMSATLREGVRRAREVIAQGLAARKLDEFVRFTKAL